MAPQVLSFSFVCFVLVKEELRFLFFCGLSFWSSCWLVQLWNPRKLVKIWIYKIKKEMKHLKIFEQVASSLPEFDVEEIKNLSVEDFFQAMDMYHRANDDEQLKSLYQIFTEYNGDKIKRSQAATERLGSSAWYNKIAGFHDEMRDFKIDMEFDKIKKDIDMVRDMSKRYMMMGEDQDRREFIRDIKKVIENFKMKFS